MKIEIPDDVTIQTLAGGELPEDWNADVHPESTRAIGAQWITASRTAILSVPSTVNPYERNFVLNPAHADFRRFLFSDPEPFTFPDRFKRRL